MHGKTRTECLMRLKRALDEFVVDGIETTLPLFRKLVRNQDIIDGNYHIHWLEQFLAEGGMDARTSRRQAAHVAPRSAAISRRVDAAITLSIAQTSRRTVGLGHERSQPGTACELLEPAQRPEA